jgi:hypothetical protein
LSKRLAGGAVVLWQLFLEAIKDELDARGDAEFVENAKHIVANDSGSTVLGFCVAFLALDFYRGNGAGATSIAFPIVVAGLPILDAVFAVQRRLQNRASPFYGDRRHFYDLLLSRGWRPSRVVFVCVAITAALSVAASIALRVQAELGATIQVLSVAALAAAAIRFGSLRADDARRPRAPMPRAITPRA